MYNWVITKNQWLLRKGESFLTHGLASRPCFSQWPYSYEYTAGQIGLQGPLTIKTGNKDDREFGSGWEPGEIRGEFGV